MLVIYRPYSEHGRPVEEFVHEYSRRYPEGRVELLNVDGRDGNATASLYDVMSYPAILAVRDDGSVIMAWQGDQLPLLDEVAGYVLA